MLFSPPSILSGYQNDTEREKTSQAGFPRELFPGNRQSEPEAGLDWWEGRPDLFFPSRRCEPAIPGAPLSLSEGRAAGSYRMMNCVNPGKRD